MNLELHDLPVVFFEENGVIIAHCLPLDVSSCGHTEEEARDNIRDALAGFIEACDEMGTLHQVLEEAGFVQRGSEWTPPTLLGIRNLDIQV